MGCISLRDGTVAARSLVVLLLGGVLLSVGAQELGRKSRPGTVATNVLNVRARPGTNYEVIAKFKQGDKLQVYGSKEEWLEVGVPPQADAWMVARFLEVDGTVNADRVRIHSGPGVVFSHYGFGTKGGKVRRIGEVTADGWQKIEAPAGTTAWVNGKFVALDPLRDGDSALSAQGDVGIKGRATGTPPSAIVPAPGVSPGLEKAQTEEATAAPADAGGKPEVAVSPAAPREATSGGTLDGPAVRGEVAVVETGVKKTAAISPEPQGDGTGSAPVPGAATPTTPATIGDTVMREGTLSSLKSQGSRACTHLLSVRMEDTLYPVCFLVSSKVSLEEWEGQKVRVHGREIWYPGWKRPVIGVTRIQRLAP